MLDGVRIGMTFGLVLAVPLVCWRLLRDRRGAVPITVGCTLGYLVLGNLLARVTLLDVIFPADWSGRTDAQVQQLLFAHTAVSMGGAAVTAVAAAVGLARVLQRATPAAAPSPPAGSPGA